MKCSGDKDGCRRCVENNAQCLYSKTSQSKSAPKEHEQDNQGHEQEPKLLTPTTSMSTLTQQDSLTLDASPAGVLQQVMDLSDIASPTWFSDTYTFLDPGIMAGGICNPGLDFSPNRDFSEPAIMSAGSSDSTGNLQSSDNSITAGGGISVSDYAKLDFDLSAAVMSGGSGGDGSSSRCVCSEMMRVYEMAEIYLVWSLGGRLAAITPRPDEILQCQKQVLAKCESILDCDTCSLQPEQAILIISILNKVRVSIRKMSCASFLPSDLDMDKDDSSVLYKQQKGSISSSSSSRSLSRQRQESFSRGSTRFTGGSASLSDDKDPKQGEAFSSITNTVAKTNPSSAIFEPGSWAVDNEDKVHMFKCLLNVRVAKLNELLNRLAKVSQVNNWLVHWSILKDLAGSCE